METIAEKKERLRAGIKGQQMPDGKILMELTPGERELLQDPEKLAEHRIESARESRRITHKDLSIVVG